MGRRFGWIGDLVGLGYAWLEIWFSWAGISWAAQMVWVGWRCWAGISWAAQMVWVGWRFGWPVLRWVRGQKFGCVEYLDGLHSWLSLIGQLVPLEICLRPKFSSV